MRSYRELHNTASFFTHHTTEAAARADFECTVTNGCTEGWGESELQGVRNLLTAHYGQSKRRIVWKDWGPSPQDAQGPYRRNGEGAENPKRGW